MDGDSCPLASDSSALSAAAKQLGICAETSPGNCCNQPNVDKVLCALAPAGTTCCYTVEVQDSGLCIGRPFTVDGALRAARPIARGDWSEGDLPDCEALDAITRAELARAWAEDAALEHASVASFARLSLELLAVGAPPELLSGAQQAMGDEIRHAQLSYALAGAYAGAPLGPAPLRVEGALRETSLLSVAVDTVREGCIGETIAALVAAEAAETATDPAVKQALASIAEEESEHAALAFRIASWAYRAGDHAVRAAIEAAFHAAAAPTIATLPPGVDEALWQHHGRLPPSEIQSIATEALSGIIVPAFEALRTELTAS
jgi:hypothetical protein